MGNWDCVEGGAGADEMGGVEGTYMGHAKGKEGKV